MKKFYLLTFIFSFFNYLAVFCFTPRNTNNEVQLGINGVASYGRPLFANAVYNEPRGWQNNSNQSITDATLFDSDGFPLKLTTTVPKMVIQPGQNSSDSRYAYAGKVCVTWQGNADIRVIPPTDGYFISTGSGAQTGSIVDGVRYYNNGSYPNGIRVEILAIDETNPPKNIKVWMCDLNDPTKTLRPEDQGDTTFLIHPSYAEKFLNSDNFSILRPMDLLMTNETKITDWADRRKPTHCFQSGNLGNYKVGASYETIIKMCNQFHKDLWLNIPTFANETFITKLAQLIQGKDPDNIGSPGLDADLRCYVELSNELGWTYWSTECTSAGALLSPAITGRQYAARLKSKATSVFRNAVDPDKTDQFKFIHSIQTSDFSSSDKELQEVIPDGSYGATLVPNGKPDFIGITTYFGSKIEQEVFDNYNYMDVSQRNTEVERAFTELEKRLLIGTSSTTGVDYTGGGISAAAKNLRTKYQLPFMVYEGGCGLNLASSQYVSKTDCKIAPKVTPVPSTYYGFNLFLNNYADSCQTGGKTNYTNFIRDMHNHPLMAKMYEINAVLCKMDSVNVLTQYGDCSDVKLSIDYGYWACLNSLTQDISTAYRLQFWNNWATEQKTINEVALPMDQAPYFNDTDIYPVRAGIPFKREIKVAGGNGLLHGDMINRPEILPSGFQISFDNVSNKIVLTGTVENPGSYNFLYRIMDQDNDPAYRIFRLDCLKSPMDSVFAYDDFGTPTVDNLKLDSVNTGRGFSSFWRVANASYSTDYATNFVVRNTNILNYPNTSITPTLKCSGGGKAESVPGTNTPTLVAQRPLNVSSFDYMIDPEDSEYIGRPGTTLWSSFLYNRPNTNNSTSSANRDIVRFNSKQGGFTFRQNAEVILVAGIDGNYRLDCHPLSLVTVSGSAFTSVSTNITATRTETQFLVFEFKFGLHQDTVRFYWNPTKLGVEKPDVSPAATYVTPLNDKIRLSKFIFNGYYASTKSNESIDDLRFGDSYAAVSPINPVPDTTLPGTPDNFTISEVTDNKITLNWSASTDNVAVIGYEIYYNGNKVATTSALTYSLEGITNGSHCFYIKAKDQAGLLSNPTSTLCTSDLTTIQEHDTNNDIPSIYPNPVKTHFIIRHIREHQSAQIRILDCTGKSILQTNIFSGDESIDISDLKSGLFIVELTLNNKKSYFKIVKSN